MARQAHHERNQPIAVRPELVEGLIRSESGLRGLINLAGVFNEMPAQLSTSPGSTTLSFA